MNIYIKFDLKRDTTKQSVQRIEMPHKNRKLSYKWTQLNASTFNDKIFKDSCNALYEKLNEKPLSGTEIFDELV